MLGNLNFFDRLVFALTKNHPVLNSAHFFPSEIGPQELQKFDGAVTGFSMDLE